MNKKKYQNKLSGNFTKNALDGFGMTPRPLKQHQIAIAAFIRNIPKKKSYYVLPETELAGPNSEAPDVVIFSVKTEKPLMFIEVCHNKGQAIALNKSSDAISKYNISEAFVYNYQSDVFYKITAAGSNKNESYSNFLKVELKNMQYYKL